MRALLLLVLAGCAGHSFQPAPLPELIGKPPPVAELPRRPLFSPVGEHLAYTVHLRGIAIGKVELEIRESEVISWFKTESIAAAFATVSHDLTTVVDREGARIRAGVETLVVGGEVERHELVARNGHSLHSALGVVRAWVAADAPATVLVVQALGQRYRLHLKRPLVEELHGAETFHVTATLETKAPITVQMWFAATPARTPLRFEIEGDDVRVMVNLIT